MKPCTIKPCYMKPGFVTEQTLQSKPGRCWTPGVKHKALSLLFHGLILPVWRYNMASSGIYGAILLQRCQTISGWRFLTDRLKKISHLWPCIHLNQLPLACVPCNPTWPLSSPATELKITCEVKSTIKYCEDGPGYIKIVQAPRRGAITERGAHTASSALEKNGGYGVAHNETAAWLRCRFAWGRANTILSNAVIEAPFLVVWTGSNAA